MELLQRGGGHGVAGDGWDPLPLAAKKRKQKEAVLRAACVPDDVNGGQSGRVAVESVYHKLQLLLDFGDSGRPKLGDQA